MSRLTDTIQASMLNDLQRLDHISQNLANINTAGYKKGLHFSQQLDLHSDAARSTEETVSGTKKTDFSPGMLQYTGNNLDIALEEKVFLLVNNEQGQTALTRQGRLQLDGNGRLVTAQGWQVQDVQGKDIRLNSPEVVIDPQGKILEAGQLSAQLHLVTVADTAALEKQGHHLFQSRNLDLQAVDTRGELVKQKHMEMSNVKPMEEMVNLIATTRHIELTQRVLKSYDDILEKAIRDIGDI